MRLFSRGRHTRTRSRLRVPGVAILSVVMVALFTGGVVWAADGDEEEVINACSGNFTGNLRLIDNPDNCRPWETPIS